MPPVVPALLKAWNKLHSVTKALHVCKPTQGSSFIVFHSSESFPLVTSVWFPRLSCTSEPLFKWFLCLGWHFPIFTLSSQFNSNDISFMASSLPSTTISCSLFTLSTPFSDSQDLLAYITVVHLNFSTSLCIVIMYSVSALLSQLWVPWCQGPSI